jgi:hypothetical protein
MTPEEKQRYTHLADELAEQFAGSPPTIYCIIIPEFWETTLVYHIPDTAIYQFGLSDDIRDAIFDGFDSGNSMLIINDLENNELSVISLGHL